MFELEQAIMNCWSVVDDLEILKKQENLTPENVDALKRMYQMRFDDLFKKFEYHVEQHCKFKKYYESFS